MIKAIIVEDEDKSAENLRLLVSDFCENVQIAGVAKTIAAATRLIDSIHPDLVFLDINLKNETGFDLFTSVRKVDFSIIFTTAYANYAIQAFRVAALDYLLKPIDIAQLQEAVKRVKPKVQRSYLDNKLETLIDFLNPDNPISKLAIPTVSGVYFINTNDIVYCEADGNYTTFHLCDRQKHTTSKTLKSFESLLPSDRFLRVHHSYLINLQYVKKYSKGDGTVTMLNNAELAISKRKQEQFLQKVGLK